MKIIITGKNVSLTDAIKERINSKLSKLDKFFTNETTATVTLKKENGKDVSEINIPVKGNLLRVSERQDNLFSAIDTATDKLERQIRKYRTKIRDNKIHTIMKNIAEGGFSEEKIDEEPAEIRIVKKKQLLLKPMDDEEACMQLDMIDHSFFIYENTNGKICVAYKRGDGNFGIIEPDIE
ncbi:MAG: ribosome-associated translation inhibitor RaiA [Lachnospiraceae bacterium]|nr:ribosome-associated translation inhibitor RaiA [Lachnospiraceae bacterium]